MSSALAIASGKGGVGKTTIAVNLALLQSLKSDCLLLDADMGMANAHILLGLNPDLSIRDVIEGKCELEKIISKGPNNLSFISGGSGITELRRVLELISNINITNMSITDIAETIRPALVGLLIQKICPINKPLSVITLAPEMEQIIINAAKDQSSNGLVLEPNFTQSMIKAIAKAFESATSEGINPVILTSPIIRRNLSNLVRQNIEDLNVLSFTELPENRKVKVIANIENKNTNQNKNEEKST